MFCSDYLNLRCFDGSCPRALYYEYGPDYGFEHVTCEECVCKEGDCSSCSGIDCPLDYLFAEALFLP